MTAPALRAAIVLAAVSVLVFWLPVCRWVLVPVGRWVG